MVTATTLSIEEYFATNYDGPEPEYIDGQLRERALGKYEHAFVQGLLTAWFFSHEAEWRIVALPEQTVRVSATRALVPDVTLVRPGPHPDVLVDPPLLIIEILSPGDSYAQTQRKCEDYRGMGVANMWIIDPTTRTGQTWTGNAWVAVQTLTVPATPIFADLSDVFARLEASRR